VVWRRVPFTARVGAAVALALMAIGWLVFPALRDAIEIAFLSLCLAVMLLLRIYDDARRRNPTRPRKRWLIETVGLTVYVFVMLAFFAWFISLVAGR